MPTDQTGIGPTTPMEANLVPGGFRVQHCTNGVVLLRSDDRRVRPRHLEGTV
jgi:hypothetical protein